LRESKSTCTGPSPQIFGEKEVFLIRLFLALLIWFVTNRGMSCSNRAGLSLDLNPNFAAAHPLCRVKQTRSRHSIEVRLQPNANISRICWSAPKRALS